MEQIPIREAARRLGVSDTAVRKAIAAGRVTVVGNTDRGWPLLGWPQARDEWINNSDTQKRSHVGSRGGAQRAEYATSPAEVQLPTSSAPDEAPAPADPPPPPKQRAQTQVQAQAEQDPDDEPTPPPGRQPPTGPSYAQSRAIREAYQARLAKLEFEQKSGKLISADEVKVAWIKKIKAAQTRILGIPAECKSRCSELPLAVVKVIEDVCREALEDLANGRD